MAFARATPRGLNRLFASEAARLALQRAAWPYAVGPELARRTELVALEGTTLRVRVPDARWRGELHRMRGVILSRLRDALGEQAASRLGFMEGPVASPAPLEPALPAGPAPQPPESIVASAQAIEDEELRRRFLATAGRYLARAGAPGLEGSD